LLLTDLEDSDGYRFILQRVIDSINLPIELGGSTEATVGVSIGVALFPAGSSDSDSLLKHAD
jgi:GGDEF domain-containing protein